MFTTEATVKPRKLNSDFAKYSLIRNKFWTQWIQRIGPIYKLFYILSINMYVFTHAKRKKNDNNISFWGGGGGGEVRGLYIFLCLPLYNSYFQCFKMKSSSQHFQFMRFESRYISVMFDSTLQSMGLNTQQTPS